MTERPDVPHLTTEQMIEVDRAMIDDFGIELIQMMENAGRNLAALARVRFLNGDPRGRRVVALAGPGGNGGGVLVAARRLHGWGAEVTVALGAPAERFTLVPAHQLAVVRRLGIAVVEGDGVAEPAADAELVLDGLLGYSLRGAPRGRAAMLITWANGQPAPVLALDVPSGVDAGAGEVREPAVRAAATLTLALPKEGLRERAARQRVGELYLGDISAPPGLYARPPLSLDVPAIFAREEIVRLA
jgi:NAD(P)H-hydrate epimerase